MGSSADADVKQVNSSDNVQSVSQRYDQGYNRSSSIRQVTPSNYSASSIDQFWQIRSGAYVPVRGNGVLIKHGINVDMDDLSDQKIDFAAIDEVGKFKHGQAEGWGTNADEAIKDALNKIAGQEAGAHVDSATVARNNTIEKDRTTVKTNAVIGRFIVRGMSQDNGLVRIKIVAEVKTQESQTSGVENYRDLGKHGKFNINKRTVTFDRQRRY